MAYLLLYCNPSYSNEANFTKISLDTLIALLGLVIAVLAIIISDRFQILSFIDAQLIEIAKTCNSYLQNDYQVPDETGEIKRGRASGIITALEDAEIIILQYHKRRLLVFKCDISYFKGVFYSHLHSSIKVILKDFLIEKGPGLRFEGGPIDKYDPIRIDQLEKACKFFEKEIRGTYKFEKDREKRLGIT